MLPESPPKTREITLKNDTPAKKPKTEPSNCVSQPVTIVPSSLNVSTTVSHDHDYNDCQCSSCITKDAEIKKLRAQITKLSVEYKSLKSKLLKRMDQPFGFENLRTDEQIRFFTGIPSVQAFEAILSVIKPYPSKVHYRNGPSLLSHPLKNKLSRQKRGRKRSLSAKNELLLTLMKIRLGLLNEDLAQRFGISKQNNSNNFTTWVKILGKIISDLVFNPPQRNGQGKFTPLLQKSSI